MQDVTCLRWITSNDGSNDITCYWTILITTHCMVQILINLNFRGYTRMSGQYEGGGTKTVSMFSKLMSQGSSFVMEGVKNLVVKRHVRLSYLPVNFN